MSWRHVIPYWRWCRILWRCHAGGLALLKAMAGTPIMPTSAGRRVTIGQSPHRTYTGCNDIGYLAHSLTRHTAAYLGFKRARFALCAPSAVEGTQEPALKSSTAACTCRLSCQFKSSACGWNVNACLHVIGTIGHIAWLLPSSHLDPTILSHLCNGGPQSLPCGCHILYDAVLHRNPGICCRHFHHRRCFAQSFVHQLPTSMHRIVRFVTVSLLVV